MPRPAGDAPGSGGSFISKPARGWPHPDQLITREGITYAVRVSCECLKLEGNMSNSFLG